MSPPSHILVTPAQLGSILQSTRKAQGLTQSELAERIGLSQSRVSHLELNAGALSVDQLLAWCAVLGLELTLGARGSLVISSDLATDW